jgi:DnaK suppressor protein
MKVNYSPDFLDKQRQHLLSLQEALQGGISQRPKIETTADEIDAASNESDFDFALSLLSSSSTALIDVAHALRKLDTGGYGVCELSGKVIPKARLQAIPFARYTVECQQQVEKMGLRSTRNSRESIFSAEAEEQEEDIDQDGPDL